MKSQRCIVVLEKDRSVVKHAHFVTAKGMMMGDGDAPNGPMMKVLMGGNEQTEMLGGDNVHLENFAGYP